MEFTSKHIHEETDAKVGPLAKFLVVMTVTLAFSFLFVGVLFGFFTEKVQSETEPAAPLQVRDELPPEPRLRVVPGLDLSLMETAVEERLDGYGWVDQQNQIVHIPVERAMDVLVNQGLPARSEQPAALGNASASN